MKKTTLIFCLVCAVPLAAQETDSLGLKGELDEIVVSSIRLKNETPLITQSYSDEQLQRQNTGVNLPYLLSLTPSLSVTSDDGLGVGYTYFRVRGTDQSRINMTVNGVPLNDGESQTVFWVNMTDMASSMNQVNVQRGVGTSTNGASAFGASVNMLTERAQPKPYAALSFNGGMYNTFRESVKAGTGLLDNGFAFDARVSKVNSDGYLERASSDLYSYYASGAWYGDNTMVKLLLFGGKEKTYMAWNSIDAETLKTNPRYNPAGHYVDDNGNDAFYDNQTDNYAQQHAQLHVSHRFTPNWHINGALHYTHGGGYYEQYKENAKFAKFGLPNYVDTLGQTVKRSDVIYQKHLNNHFYGGVLAVGYENASVQATLGGAVNNYQGAHWGNVLWVRRYNSSIPKDYEYYRNRADKFDANVYLKANWQIINGLQLYGDFQYRYVDYKIAGINDENLEELPLQVDYHFFNPKAGISYTNGGHNVSFSFAIANREPNRANFKENVVYNAATGEYAGMPKPERLYDYELGYIYSHIRFTVGANFYFMDYDNQLVLTGRYNDVGAASTVNVKDSYRMGMELTAGVKICEWFRWDGNFVLSRNKIKNYTDVKAIYDKEDPDYYAEEKIELAETTIAFSPTITAMSLFTFDVAGFSAGIQTGVTGKQYLNNVQDENAVLKAFSTTNVSLQYQLPMSKWCGKPHVPQIRLQCQINNIFDTKYASNGGSDCSYYTDGTAVAWFYAQAGINVHAGFTVEF